MEKKNVRNSSVELLRFVFMFMIVGGFSLLYFIGGVIIPMSIIKSEKLKFLRA